MLFHAGGLICLQEEHEGITNPTYGVAGQSKYSGMFTLLAHFVVCIGTKITMFLYDNAKM